MSPDAQGPPLRPADKRMPTQEPAVDQRIMKALSHPLRVRMLTLLNQKVSSPSELADELGEPLGNVSYHMRFLADLKMVKLVRTEPRRGAVEHYYQALEPPQVSGNDWAQLPASLRRTLSDGVLGQIAKDLSGAAKSGGFDRENMHVSRHTMVLDQEGWDELSTLLADVQQRARAIQDRSTKRLKKTRDGAAIPTSLALLQFEGGTPGPTRRTRKN
jgi:DNA-binding transcriptional ArsR family regulator